MKNKKMLTGQGIGVAVLDTGIFPHADFDNRIVAFHDFVQYKSRLYDDNGHGTHVNGLKHERLKNLLAQVVRQTPDVRGPRDMNVSWAAGFSK